jgi:hypothetical protein
MKNENLLLLMAKGAHKDNFVILDTDGDAIPPGLTPTVLQSLWQIPICFGIKYHDEYAVQCETNDHAVLRIHSIRLNHPSNFDALVVIKGEKTIDGNRDSVSIFKLKGHIILFLDSELAIATITQCIDNVDTAATRKGLIVNNERTRYGVSCREIFELITYKYN